MVYPKSIIDGLDLTAVKVPNDSDPLISNPELLRIFQTENGIRSGSIGGFTSRTGIRTAVERQREQEENEDDLKVFLEILSQIEAIDARIRDLQEILDIIEKKEALQATLLLNTQALEAAQAHQEFLRKTLTENGEELDTIVVSNGGSVVFKDDQGTYIALKNGSVEHATSEQIHALENGHIKSLNSSTRDKCQELCGHRQGILKDLQSTTERIEKLSQERITIKKDIERISEQLEAMKQKHGLEGMTDAELKEHTHDEIQRLEEHKRNLQEKIGLKDQSINALSNLGTMLNEARVGLAESSHESNPALGISLREKFAAIAEAKTETRQLVAQNAAAEIEINNNMVERALEAARAYHEMAATYKKTQTTFSETKTAQTAASAEKDSLLASQRELALTKTMVTQVQSAIGEFDGTRKEYIELAYGGAQAFHWMNAKSLLPGSAQPPLVKTDDGKIVYKDEAGLFTVKTDRKGNPLIDPETNTPIRQDITDPLTVAKLEHQAWVGSPPKLFGNERPQGVTSALGDLGNYLLRRDDKGLSAMKVQQASAVIVSQIKNLDTQVAAAETRLNDVNQHLETLQRQLAEMQQDINKLQDEGYYAEREILAAIEMDLFTPEEIRKIYDASESYFQKEIEGILDYLGEEIASSDEKQPMPAPDIGQLLADQNKAAIAAAIVEKGNMSEEDLKLVAAQYGITDPVHFETLKTELAKQQGISVRQEPQYSAAGVVMFASSLAEQQIDASASFEPDPEIAALIARSAPGLEPATPQPGRAFSPTA